MGKKTIYLADAKWGHYSWGGGASIHAKVLRDPSGEFAVGTNVVTLPIEKDHGGGRYESRLTFYVVVDYTCKLKLV
jgi:hypothetical protein